MLFFLRRIIIFCTLFVIVLIEAGTSLAFTEVNIDRLHTEIQGIIQQKKKGNANASNRLQKLAETLSKIDTHDYSQEENIARLQDFIKSGKIPSYIFAKKGQYKYIPHNNVLYLAGTHIRMRSQPNKQARIITTLNKEYTDYLTYLGEWKNPRGERWILVSNGLDRNITGELGWIYGEYVRLVPNNTIRNILSEINSAVSPQSRQTIKPVVKPQNIKTQHQSSTNTVSASPEEDSYAPGNFFQWFMEYDTLTLDRIFTVMKDSFWNIMAFIGGIIGFFSGMSDGQPFAGAFAGIILAGICLGILVLIIFLAWNYIIPFVVNSIGHVMFFAIVVAAIYGTSVAVYNYFCSLFRNINPYKYYVDHSEGAQKNVLRKSYFFGPGYASLIKTIREAAKDNIKMIKNIRTWIDEHSDGTFQGLCLSLIGWCYLIFATISIIFVGCSVTFLCSAVHLTFMSVVMMVVYVLFSVIWITDRIALYKRRINSDCHKCHERYTVPAFVCPDCKRMHTKLVPSAYGILHHVCKCGKELPCTFFNGRDQLQAVCPRCSDEEHKIFIRLHSNVHPISIQLVGALGAGKSVYLASAIIKFMETLSVCADIKVSETDKIKSDSLRKIYSTGHSSHTNAKNAVMYPVQISSPRLETDRLLSFYDIGGEFFMNAERGGTVAMVHLNYADGLLFLIDACKLKNSNNNTLEQDEIIVNSLVNYMDGIGTKRNGGKFAIPFMVLFSKSDEIDELQDNFGQGSSVTYTPTERDEKCKSLIISRSNNLMTTIESNFSEVHYYAISAAGGEMRHSHELNPWPNILTPIHDIIKLNDKELAAIILP